MKILVEDKELLNSGPAPALLRTGAILLLLLLCNLLPGQKVRFYINSDKITTDDAVQVNLEVSDAGGRIPMPAWPEVRGLQGAGNSTNQSWINGKVSVSFSRTYVPSGTGTFRIPSFTYTINGKAFPSPEFTVQVTKGQGRSAQPQRRTMNPFDAFFGDPFAPAGPKEELKFKETQADYFLSINLDKDSCYVGQQVRGEVVLYINERDYGKINVDGRDVVDMQQKIKNTGFWQEIIEFEQVPVNRVVIDGKRYVAYTLYQTILFPIRSGKIEFKGIDLGAKKLYVATNASIMDAFTGANQKYEPIRIKANERSLHVKPLPPTNLPAANMVGKFKMDASLSQAEANTGDNLELRVKVSGDGNMAMMEYPDPSFPGNFRNDGTSNDYSSKTGPGGYEGDKLFKYYLVPTQAGQYNLGPLKFYYFDPKRRAYDSIVVADVPVVVKGEDLTDKLMRDRGMDSFYEQGIAGASTKLRRDAGQVWYFWALGVAVLLGGVVARIVMARTRKDRN